jgi:hypothetical protein
MSKKQGNEIVVAVEPKANESLPAELEPVAGTQPVAAQNLTVWSEPAEQRQKILGRIRTVKLDGFGGGSVKIEGVNFKTPVHRLPNEGLVVDGVTLTVNLIIEGHPGIAVDDVPFLKRQATRILEPMAFAEARQAPAPVGIQVDEDGMLFLSEVMEEHFPGGWAPDTGKRWTFFGGFTKLAQGEAAEDLIVVDGQQFQPVWMRAGDAESSRKIVFEHIERHNEAVLRRNERKARKQSFRTGAQDLRVGLEDQLRRLKFAGNMALAEEIRGVLKKKPASGHPNLPQWNKSAEATLSTAQSAWVTDQYLSPWLLEQMWVVVDVASDQEAHLELLMELEELVKSSMAAAAEAKKKTAEPETATSANKIERPLVIEVALALINASEAERQAPVIVNKTLLPGNPATEGVRLRQLDELNSATTPDPIQVALDKLAQLKDVVDAVFADMPVEEATAPIKNFGAVHLNTASSKKNAGGNKKNAGSKKNEGGNK